MGLVRSPMSTCKVLEDVALRHTTDGFGGRFRDAVAPLRIYHRELADVQNSQRTLGVPAQPESHSNALLNTEGHLKILEESIQAMDRYRRTFGSRWQNRGLCRRDIKVARSSIHLVMNMVKTLKVVQRQVHDDTLRMEEVGHTSTGDDDFNSRSTVDVSTRPRDLNFFTEDIATI